MKNRRFSLIIAVLSLFMLLVIAPPAHALPQGPDLVNTMGVGSRAIAMGCAFCAIADDASASFWNPARLGDIPYGTAMLEFRTSLNTSDRDGTGSATNFADIWDPGHIVAAGNHLEELRPTFVGFTKAIGDYQGSLVQGGTIGVSYTVAGYLDLNYREFYPTAIQQTKNQYDLRVTQCLFHRGVRQKLPDDQPGQLRECRDGEKEKAAGI